MTPSIPSRRGFSRRYLPAAFDGSAWPAIEPLVNELAARVVSSARDFEAWLHDRSELDSGCSEVRANLYIAHTCNTDDQGANRAYTRYLEEVSPRLEEAAFALDRRQVALHAQFPLDPARYHVLERSKRTAVELFRQENVPIQVELAKLVQEYGTVAGAQTVHFDGAERTLPQMGPYLLSADRAVREAAWRGMADRRLQDRGALDDLFDRMIERRHRLARNAGQRGYVEYIFLEKERFDYTPAHCRAFWDGVEKHVMPLVRRIDERRRAALGLEALRPWDLQADIKGRGRLTPFEGGRELVEKSAATFAALDPRLSELFSRLTDQPPAASGASGDRGYVTECLDLDSRKGKRPGGYMYTRDLARRPFIFMNAAGTQRDVMTMVHEAGHAFHSLMCVEEPVADYRRSPIEFAEVASMSMELLTMPCWGVQGAFYPDQTDLHRARREHLIDAVTQLAWVATIDAFQHWIYEHPGHTRAQRDDHWLELDARFGRVRGWSGWPNAAEHARAAWQRQSHLFSHPMYYIEYGIAQLGALGLWRTSLEHGSAVAIDAYLRALALGGSRPLPELFAAAGLPFDFGEIAIGRVVESVERELETMGE